MQHSQDELHRIIEADYLKNHQGREYSCAQVKSIMDKWVAMGKFLFCAKGVFFMGEEGEDPDTFEFHSCNGGEGRDLTEGINRLLESLAPHYQLAVTFYDNPRVSELARFIKYPSTVTRIDEGQDRTFAMHFNLRT